MAALEAQATTTAEQGNALAEAHATREKQQQDALATAQSAHEWVDMSGEGMMGNAMDEDRVGAPARPKRSRRGGS
jgi:hypothetical protein